MILRRAILAGCLTAVAWVPAVMGQDQATEWTLTRTLSRVRQQHPLFAAEQEADTARAAEVDRLKGAWDWVFRSNPYALYVEPVDASAFTPTERSQVSVDAAVQRVLPQHGGRLSLRAYADTVDQSVPEVPLPGPGGGGFSTAASTFFQDGVFATYQVPLLRNRGGTQDRFGKEQQEYANQLAHLQGEEALESFLERVALVYLDWVLLSEQRTIGQDQLKLSEEQQTNLETQYADGLVDEVDVLRANEDVLSVRQSIAFTESRLMATRERLAAWIGEEADRIRAPSFDLHDYPEFPAEPDPVANRALRGYALVARQAQHALGAARDEGRWQLDAVVSGGLRGGAEDADGFLEPDRPEVRVGLVVQRELGRSGAQAAMKRARALEAEARHREAAARIDLQGNSRALEQQMGRLRGILALDKERIRVAQARTKSEQALYARGKSSLLFVLQAQAAETRAEERQAVNAIQLHQLKIRWDALHDRLYRPGTPLSP